MPARKQDKLPEHVIEDVIIEIRELRPPKNWSKAGKPRFPVTAIKAYELAKADLLRAIKTISLQGD